MGLPGETRAPCEGFSCLAFPTGLHRRGVKVVGLRPRSACPWNPQITTVCNIYVKTVPRGGVSSPTFQD